MISIINIANAIINDKHSYVLIIEPPPLKLHPTTLSAVIGVNRSAYSTIYKKHYNMILYLFQANKNNYILFYNKHIKNNIFKK